MFRQRWSIKEKTSERKEKPFEMNHFSGKKKPFAMNRTFFLVMTMFLDLVLTWNDNSSTPAAPGKEFCLFDIISTEDLYWEQFNFYNY